MSETNYNIPRACLLNSLVDSQKNCSKSEESMKIGTLSLFDALFHIKTGHKLREASMERF